jgi:cholesterol transport system auxiliary component
MKMQRLIILSCLGALLAGCSLGNVPPAPTLLDLGPPPQQTGTYTGTLPPLAVTPVAAIGTLQSQKVIWRIGANGQPNAYATVRWASPPAVMVRERLFERLSRQAPVLTEEVNAEMPLLRSSLLQFEQIFSANGNESEAVVSLQVVVVVNTQVLDQFRVTRRVKAQDNTAEGGAQALRTATDEATNDIAQWVAQALRRSK